MSRRDAGAPRHEARHARDRLQSTLGGGLLLTDGGGKVFEYDGGGQLAGADPESGAAGAVAGKTGPALRWRVGFRVALLIAALSVLGGAWFWLQVAAGQPQVVPLRDVSPQGSPAAGHGAPPEHDAAGPDLAVSAEESVQPAVVIIHVAGAVAVPGVVHLVAGSRVHQAIAAAGGGTPAAELDRLNLAAVLADGQKLYVPRAGEQMPAGQSDSGGQGGDAGLGGGIPAAEIKINLNTAGVEELDTLPKVGPVLAQRIVAWRKAHGPFKSVEELDAVEGVGPKMLETLLPLVSV